MSAGLRDLLALQGVIPLSKSVVTVSPGLTLGQASGVWVSGVPAATGATPGLTLLQISGVWITGAPEAAVVVPDTGGGGSRYALLLREDQEIIDIITAIGPSLVRMV